MLIDLALITAGFFLLIKGAGFLVDSAVSLAKHFRVSEFVIGLTLVAFGTSMPEFFVNLTASAQGNPEIVLGNILGSSIYNILVILGLSAVIFPLVVTANTVWKEIPLGLMAGVLVFVLANDRLIDNGVTSQIARMDGVVLLLFFVIFMCYVFELARGQRTALPKISSKYISVAKTSLLLAAGLILLIAGSKFVVNGSVQLALSLGVSEYLIALTVVSIGTALPELVTSAVAAFRKNSDIAVGNVVGSNMFNIFFILGICSVVRPIPVNIQKDNIDILVLVFASLALFLGMHIGKKHCLKKYQGALFIFCYIIYTVFIIFRG